MARPELTRYTAFRRFRLMGHDYVPGDKIQRRHLNARLVRILLEYGKIVNMEDIDDLPDPRRDHLKNVTAD